MKGLGLKCHVINGYGSLSSMELITRSAISQSLNRYMAAGGHLISLCGKEHKACFCLSHKCAKRDEVWM